MAGLRGGSQQKKERRGQIAKEEKRVGFVWFLFQEEKSKGVGLGWVGV